MQRTNNIIFAEAKVNDKYRWKDTFANVIIQVIKNENTISFIEKYNGKINILSKETVRSLFPEEVPLSDIPFLKDENIEFYSFLREPKKIIRNNSKLIRLNT